jgi:hypothetical protein
MTCMTQAGKISSADYLVAQVSSSWSHCNSVKSTHFAEKNNRHRLMIHPKLLILEATGRVWPITARGDRGWHVTGRSVPERYFAVHFGLYRPSRTAQAKGGSSLRIVVINHLTLDGVMQAPGRPDEDTRGGFSHGGWATPGNEEAMVQAIEIDF